MGMYISPTDGRLTGWPQCNSSSTFFHKCVLRQGCFIRVDAFALLFGVLLSLVATLIMLVCTQGKGVGRREKRLQMRLSVKAPSSWTWLCLVPISLYFSFGPYGSLRTLQKSFSSALWSLHPKCFLQHVLGPVFWEHVLLGLLLCS